MPAHAATADRRAEILDGALACFTEEGYAAATLESIRRRSGASIGSIYHHFRNKEDIAAALYLDGLAGYHAGLLGALRKKRSAEALVKTLVEYHLDWVSANPGWARFLLEMRRAESIQAVEDEIRRRNQVNYGAIFALFAPYFADGTLINMPRSVFTSIVLGPAQDFARHWLHGRAHADFAVAKRLMGQAAWHSVRSQGKETP